MNELAIQHKDAIDQITSINIQEFLISVGFSDFENARRIMEHFLRPLARRFAGYAVEFDREVELYGLQEAAQRAIRKYVRCLDVYGNDHIPSSGPVLILSNHPGMTDTLALTSTITRPDLRIIAQERTLLHLLPAITQRIIYVPRAFEDRIDMIREVIHHLIEGGAVLTFPAGRIEPDPVVMQGAVDSLRQWSDSILLFARKVPEIHVIPAVVAGVVSKTAMSHPLTHVRHLTIDRQRMGYTLQLLANVLFPSLVHIHPRVEFGQPIIGRSLLESGSREGSMDILLAHVQGIMDKLNGGLPTTT